MPLPAPQGVRVKATNQVLTEAELAALEERVEAGLTHCFEYAYRPAGGTAQHFAGVTIQPFVHSGASFELLLGSTTDEQVCNRNAE